MALVTGWNRSTWNSGSWNEPIPVEVTGVSAASGIGSPTVAGDANVSVTGVSAASGIGSTQINFAFTVEGVSATASVSQATVWGVIDTSETPGWSGVSSSQTPSWSSISSSQTPSWTKIAA